MKYRHLGRKSSHRQALLRNLVTSLFTHESITTTWPKAKEAQRLAEKLITLGKKNSEASKRRALSIFYVCTGWFNISIERNRTISSKRRPTDESYRHHMNYFQNSSDLFESAMPRDLVDIQGSYGSNRQNMIRLHQLF